MSTPIEALKMALEVLENVRQYDKGDWYGLDDAIDAIKEALAQPEQEPDAPDIVVVDDSNSQTNTMSWAINLPLPIGTPLYTSPSASKPWVGLTDKETITQANNEVFSQAFARGAIWAQLKLKEKNT